jgi:hypothetical protein
VSDEKLTRAPPLVIKEFFLQEPIKKINTKEVKNILFIPELEIVLRKASVSPHLE